MTTTDNDAVFAADVDIDAALRSDPADKRKGPLGVASDRVNGQASAHAEHEETPLLGHESPSQSDRGSTMCEEGSSGAEWPGSEDLDALPWWKRPSIYWLLPPFLVFALAFGGIVVPKISLILNLICREYFADKSSADPDFTFLPVVFGEDNPQCRIPEIQSRIAQFTLYGNLISGLLAAITSPKLGALSDRYGRKKLLGVTTLGMLSAEIITIFAAKFPEAFPVNWILVAYALDGLAGSFILAMALVHSYATDCTPPEDRNIAFGYFHGCLFTGIALGPIIAGYIIRGTGSVLSVFYIALGCHVFFILFAAVFVPESLSKSRQLAAREEHKLARLQAGPASDWINQIRSFNLLEPLKILYPTGEGSSSAVRRNLIFLASVDTIMFGVAMGSMTVIIIYVNYKFGWATFEQTVFTSIVNTCRVTALMVILPIVTRIVRSRSGPPLRGNSGSDLFDLSVIRFAVFFDMLGYLGYALASNGPLFILSGVVASVGGMGSPTLQSALTKHVPPDRTGQLLGATGLLHALARILGPTLFNGIYSATVSTFPQTVFVCLTATFGVAFLCSWFIRPYVYLEKPDVPSGAPSARAYPP